MTDMTVYGVQSLKKGTSYKKYSVGNGLFIGVSTNGEKGYVIRYSVNGKQEEYRHPKNFGTTTDAAHLSLSDAKFLTAEIKALGKAGVDYQKKIVNDLKVVAEKIVEAAAENRTVNDLFDAWFKTTDRKDDGAALLRSFKRDVLPFIGILFLKQLEEWHIVDLLKPISDKGNNRTAEVTLDNLKQMFKWGEGRKPWKLLIDNPTMNLKAGDVTQKGYERVERDRHLSDGEIVELVTKLPNARLQKHIEIIIFLTLSCCTRIGETLMAKWSDVDLDNGVWFIPEDNTKGKSPSHTILLSAFSIKQFSLLKKITGEGEWCFPNRDNTSHSCTKSPTKQIADRQHSGKNGNGPLKNRSSRHDALLLSNGDWTPHDLRRTGATMMQALSVDQHVIERVLNHSEENRMARIYQQHDYANELKHAWSVLGVRLELLTQGKWI